jgi:hypothetical protein
LKLPRVEIAQAACVTELSFHGAKEFFGLFNEVGSFLAGEAALSARDAAEYRDGRL